MPGFPVAVDISRASASDPSGGGKPSGHGFASGEDDQCHRQVRQSAAGPGRACRVPRQRLACLDIEEVDGGPATELQAPKVSDRAGIVRTEHADGAGERFDAGLIVAREAQRESLEEQEGHGCALIAAAKDLLGGGDEAARHRLARVERSREGFDRCLRREPRVERLEVTGCAEKHRRCLRRFASRIVDRAAHPCGLRPPERIG